MFTLTTLKYCGVISLVTYALAFWAAYPMVIGELGMALLWVVVVGVLDSTDGKLARLREKKTLIGKSSTASICSSLKKAERGASNCSEVIPAKTSI